MIILLPLLNAHTLLAAYIATAFNYSLAVGPAARIERPNQCTAFKRLFRLRGHFLRGLP